MSTPDPGPVTKPPSTLVANNNNLIIYITIAIIIGLVILWILIIIFTNDDPLAILNSMNDFNSQITPATDRITPSQ